MDEVVIVQPISGEAMTPGDRDAYFESIDLDDATVRSHSFC